MCKPLLKAYAIVSLAVLITPGLSCSSDTKVESSGADSGNDGGGDAAGGNGGDAAGGSGGLEGQCIAQGQCDSGKTCCAMEGWRFDSANGCVEKEKVLFACASSDNCNPSLVIGCYEVSEASGTAVYKTSLQWPEPSLPAHVTSCANGSVHNAPTCP